MSITPTIIAASVIVLASLSGKLLTIFGGESFIQKNIRTFGMFAAGIFAVIVIGNISEGAHELGFVVAILAAILGFLIVQTIESLLPEAHHHHTPDDDHTHNRTSSWKIQIADGMHNIVDGILLATTFGVGSAAGIRQSIGVFVHEYVQETGEYFALRASGLGSRAALVQNFLVALTIFIGVGIGLWAHQFETIIPWIMTLSAGAYTHVITRELVPKNIFNGSRNTVLRYLAAGVLGIACMVLLGLAFPHSHEHAPDSAHQGEVLPAEHEEHEHQEHSDPKHDEPVTDL